jgi:large subunit ribosomal protein L16
LTIFIISYKKNISNELIVTLCKIIKLQPRTYFYKKNHKKRQFRKAKLQSKLTYGQIGLILLQPIQISTDRFSKIKLLLKRAVKKADKTERFLWIKSFPHLPLAKKAPNSRMGKGRGKLKNWYTNIKGGVVLFEFLNARIGRIRYFLRQLHFRLGVITKIIMNARIRLALPMKKNKSALLRSR